MPKKKPPEPKWLHAPTKAVIYARISPRPQPGEISIEKQIDDCGTLARLSHVDVIEILDDFKLSGKRREHRKIDQAIELCKANNYMLIAYDLGRISRNFRDLINILDELEIANVAVKVVSGPQVDTSSPMGRCALRMMIAIYAYVREQTSVSTKEALAYRKSKRLSHGGNDRMAWGWKRKSLDPLDPDYKIMIPHLWEARIEAWVAWRAKLGFGPNQLLFELMSRDQKGRGNKFPNKHTIIKMHKLGLGTNLKGELPILDVSDLHIHRMHLAGTLGVLGLDQNWRRLTHRRLLVHRLNVDKLMDEEGYLRPGIGPQELYDAWDSRADEFEKSLAPPRDIEVLKAMQLFRD